MSTNFYENGMLGSLVSQACVHVGRKIIEAFVAITGQNIKPYDHMGPPIWSLNAVNR